MELRLYIHQGFCHIEPCIRFYLNLRKESWINITVSALAEVNGLLPYRHLYQQLGVPLIIGDLLSVSNYGSLETEERYFGFALVVIEQCTDIIKSRLILVAGTLAIEDIAEELVLCIIKRLLDSL
jgi:hypothetical protein